MVPFPARLFRLGLVALCLIALTAVACQQARRGGGGDDDDSGTPEDCSDQVDNDGDGFADCDDQDCWGSEDCGGDDDDTAGDDDDTATNDDDTASGESDCDDGVDNDGDNYTDCEDVDCAGQWPCNDEAQHCTDSSDNDLDGLVDCADPDCFGEIGCTSEYLCDDGQDNDADGLVDCDDPNCLGFPECSGDDDDSTPSGDDDDSTPTGDDDDATPIGDDDDSTPTGDGFSCTTTGSISCGQTISGDTSTDGISNIDIYSCSTWWHYGPEVAYDFVNPSAVNTNVEITITSLTTNQLTALVIEDLGNGCDEAGCIAYGGWYFTWTSNPSSTYYVVVDTFSTWPGGPYNLEVLCSP